MERMRSLLAAVAIIACGTVRAAPLPAPDPVQAGFFAIPVHPVAYSFADICNLSIEPGSFPIRDTDPLAAADVPLAWSRTERPRRTEPAAIGARRADQAAAPTAFSLASSMPEPSDWMRLCGVALIALIAKRRHDWSVLRGSALGAPAPMRPRGRLQPSV